jgi:hypothetical protein
MLRRVGLFPESDHVKSFDPENLVCKCDRHVLPLCLQATCISSSVRCTDGWSDMPGTLDSQAEEVQKRET